MSRPCVRPWLEVLEDRTVPSNVNWSYNFTPTQSFISADAPGTGTVSFTDEPNQSATNSSNVVVTNLRVSSTATASSPDTLNTSGAWSVSLQLTDDASNATDAMTFSGKLGGTFSATSANITDSFTGQTTQTVMLGGNTYTVSLVGFVPPGPPTSSNAGSISASVQVTPAGPTATTTAASDASTPFSTSDQDVTLTANVKSSPGTVNEGTVTFTVMQGSTTIGTATTSGTVNSGSASVQYVLPGGTPAGSYTIDAVYSGGPDFTGSSDNSRTLTVSAASTTIAASDAAVVFNTSQQNISLTANVSSSAGPVNEGAVTFTLMQGPTPVGTATTSGTVNNGAATVSYLLPGGTPAGSYTVDAVYNPGPDFTSSSDNTHALTVGAASPLSLGPPSPPSSPPSPPPSLPAAPGDYLALFQTQFMLTLDSTLSLALSFVHFSNPEFDNLIAALQQDIDANPATGTAAGAVAISLGASSAVQMLTR